MIHFVRGDMFEHPVDIRVNTVNCVGVMGAGVAEEMKCRYSEMYREYRRACYAGEVQPGVLHVWRGPDAVVVNLPTKRHWRGRSTYEDVDAGLAALRVYLAPLGRVRVTLPAPGCGHGGLDWARVSVMVERYLGDLDAEVLAFAPEDSRRW